MCSHKAEVWQRAPAAHTLASQHKWVMDTGKGMGCQAPILQEFLEAHKSWEDCWRNAPKP